MDKLQLRGDLLDQARAIVEGGPHSLEELIEAHLEVGCVLRAPCVFCLVRPVLTTWNLKSLLFPWMVTAYADAWWVYVLVGEPGHALSFLPRFLPHIGFERRGRTRWLSTQRLIDKLWQKEDQ